MRIEDFTWEIEMVSPLIDPIIHDLRPVHDGETVWYEVQGRYEPAIEILAQEGVDVGEMPYRKVLKFICDVAREWIETNTTSQSYLVEVRRGKIDAAFSDPDEAFAFKMRFG